VTVVLDEYYPFATGAGSNVTEAQWREMASAWLGTGVLADEGDEFATTQRVAGANMSVDVGTGQVRIQGTVGIESDDNNVAITANASGNPRIDLLVARGDWVNKRIELDVLVGTPAVSPAVPTPTQNNTTMWEVPLYEIAVAAGATSIVNANLTDVREIVTPGSGGGVTLDQAVLAAQMFS
jgi:hypothetical protein